MSLNPEQIIQINIVNWFHHNFPDFADDFHHFANERKCSIAQGKTLKRMGVKKGVADFHLGIVTDKYSGLWIELKTEKGKLSDAQKHFLSRKQSRGYCALVAYGEKEAKESLLTYMNEYYAISNNKELKNSIKN